MTTDYNGLTITGTPAEMFDFAQLMQPKPAKRAPDPKTPANKKTLDMGKVKALRQAGWSLDKIADEMGCSAQTIANRLKGAE